LLFMSPADLVTVIKGFYVNLIVALCSFTLGFLLALSAFLQTKLFDTAARLLKAVFAILRSIPTLVLVSLIYWGLLPATGFSRDPLTAVIIALGVRSSAFQFQILSSYSESKAILQQIELAEALGLRRFDTVVHIVLPQVLYASVPAMINEIASLLKESTVGLAVGLLDALATARYISIAQRYSLLWFIVVAALMYISSVALSAATRILWRRALFIPGLVGSEVAKRWG